MAPKSAARIIKDDSYDSDQPLAPKWNSETNDGELVDDASRFGGNKKDSKDAYEKRHGKSFCCMRASVE